MQGSGMLRRALAVTLMIGALVMARQSLGAQENARPDDAGEEQECLAFAFGRFVPALDAKAAGHASLPSADMVPHAPESRDWASRDSSRAGMSLMLYPAWWPVGVLVELPRTRLGSDTLKGTASALVADGRVAVPTAKILAWAVPCGKPNATRSLRGSDPSRDFPGAPAGQARDSLSPRDSARAAPGAKRPASPPCAACSRPASRRPR